MGCRRNDRRQALKIKQIDHVSINVTNAARSYAFYRRVLGLKQLETVDCGDFGLRIGGEDR